MALSSPMKISFLLFLLTLLSSHQIHARDSQFFNKIPSNNNNKAAYEIQPKQEEDPLDKLEQEEPNFIPQNNQNAAYGLYGQESAQLPPSTTNLPYKNKNEVEPNEFLPKYLPKNYNTEAYVTEPEGYHPAQETNTNNNYYHTQNQGQGYHPTQETNTNNFYQTQNQGQGYPATTAPTAANYYQNYGGDIDTDTGNNNYYNGQQQGVNQYNLGQKSYTTSGAGGDSSNYNNVVAAAAANRQGMSDTRFLENGKYFYDLNLEKNTNSYPSADNTRRYGDQYRKYGGYYGNEINSNEFSNYSNDGFESQGEQFQEDDEGLP